MARLQDKIAIVTGGGTGIGEATCKRFAEEGAVVIVAERDHDSGERVAAAIVAAGGRAGFTGVDVAQESEVAALVATTLAAHGKIDILVNNAAVPGVNKLAHEVNVADWDAVFAINVRGSFLCTKHVVVPMMKAKRGSIVNFSSIYALIGNDDLPPYHATKGAVLAMTRTDAVCYAPYGIRVNAVHPGSTMTPLFLRAGDSYPGGRKHYIEMMQTKHPLPLAEPVDIANCVLFLASDEARFVTGSSLVCDGGYTAQ